MCKSEKGVDRELNFLHLKYIAEVERTGSITKAASNLFMGQPNLSKAIKELETETGITIFKRTARGVEPTKKGQVFLEQAKQILSSVEELERLYKPKNPNTFEFDISVPRASYVTHAFTKFLEKFSDTQRISVNFRETSSSEAISDIINAVSNLAIIRYQDIYEPYFLSLLAEKDMEYRTLWEFEYYAVMSKEHPLADTDELTYQKLRNYIEIVHGDFSVPSLSSSYIRKSNPQNVPDKRIFIYERGSQFDLLTEIPDTFMWVSPIPESVLDRYGLVQKKCTNGIGLNKDVLIYSKNYKLTDNDNLFIAELEKVRDKLIEAEKNKKEKYSNEKNV